MVRTHRTHGVLVGFDGSQESERALNWAAHEAFIRRTGLTVCTAWSPLDPLAFEDDAAAKLARYPAQKTLARGVAHARHKLGDAAVKPLLARGGAGHVLCEHAAHADMVVVGSVGHGAMTDLLLGSVGAHVAAHAPGRAVVVRGGRHPSVEYVPGDVVVGYDGSPAAEAALDCAFEEARLHEAPLVVIHARTGDGLSVVRGLDRDRDGDVDADADVDVDEAVAVAVNQDGTEAVRQAVERRRERYPEVGVAVRLPSERPVRALQDASRHARLLVVGSRGLGEIQGMMLGSVSRAMLHHSACPVLIVHARPLDEGPDTAAGDRRGAGRTPAEPVGHRS